MPKDKILIGIDPGTTTGLAVKNLSNRGVFLEILSGGILDMMDIVKKYKDQACLYLVFEDARKRTWFSNKDREALQGAGSIKRDCAIWEEFCKKQGINFISVPPAKGKTKYTADFFKRLTGWEGRTNEHSRDAAMLAFGFNAYNLKLHFRINELEK
ncbi:MAG: hypothetical protein HC874_14105 [Richelia sp. SL_2_1]|nr:hypothetical protein [Richelia sp. SL_2_1]